MSEDSGYNLSEEQILEALNSSGFIFEQRVSKRLEECGISNRTGVSYLDPDEGKSREIDIVGSFGIALDSAEGLTHIDLDLIIECKSTMQPHVVFVRPWGPGDMAPPFEVNFEKIDEATSKSAKKKKYSDSSVRPFHGSWMSFGLLSAWLPCRLDQIQRGVQLVRVERAAKKFVARNALFEMCMPPVKAMLDRRSRASGDAIYFPACVVAGPIYTTSIKGPDEPILNKTKFCCVQFENSSSWAADSNGIHTVDLVSYDHIAEWVDHVKNVSISIAKKTLQGLEEYSSAVSRWRSPEDAAKAKRMRDQTVESDHELTEKDGD
ncbi:MULTISPECIES: hypothetical protein [Amycolatopsis]|uniref:Uncharacterized protein n=1 Tax=Amycolatopsis bullii TaxID=941987 RepID=A0ABQ3K930_9PSEU|nr:hypothetical protein [Amycolatopsis bullii]GHG08871.1 hypothetical protein GCM10017567_27100 [Amycolatopsis bullii]